MSISIGDYVAWDFEKHCLSKESSIWFITPKMLFKGYVEKIKTHNFFFFKRSFPLYKVNGVWVREVKPVVTVKYKKYTSPDGAIYEADSCIVTKHKEIVS